MKKFLKAIILSISSLLCFGCTKEIDSDITSLTYNIDRGLGGYCTYSIETEEKVIFSKECVGIVDADIKKEIDEYHLDEIKKIINEHKIYKWNGFDRYNKYVLDGSGFSLNIYYKNGKSIIAHGYMSYPNNYHENSKHLLDYLENLTK